ncbi:MAG: hypothetical protein KDK71_00480 [Chlamydiia bacterium]|nr:hypothetical protein [Chlamydiia bacterium]
MNRRILILTCSVISVHLFFFFFNFSKSHKPPKAKQSIIVRTFTPPPPTIRQIETKTVKKGAKPQVNRKNDDLLNDLKESLTKIEKQNAIEMPTPLFFPKNIPSLEIDQAEEPEVTDYFTLIAQTLKSELELPELGDVKLELTVLNNGKVMKLHILHTESEKNRRYLELKLPTLILPSFTEDLKNKPEHTFTLTFCNEVS